MIKSFKPVYSILPEAQKQIWPQLKEIKSLGFVLYGGTALALRYGHRQSIDFDFFTDQPLDHDKIVKFLPCAHHAEVLQSQKNAYTLLIPVAENYVKISFFGTLEFGRVGIPELTRDKNILVASQEDILATKLKTILQRVEVKDYIDIASLLEHGMSLEYGLASTVALFGKTFSPVDCLRALEYFDDPALKTLSESYKLVLKKEITNVLSNRNLPPVKIVSKTLSAPL